MAHISYIGLPRNIANIEQFARRCTEVVNRIMTGKINVNGEVTLVDSVASTTLTDARIAVETNIILVPLTANASAEIGNGTIFIPESGRVNGSVDITHANNGQTDRDFRYTLIG